MAHLNVRDKSALSLSSNKSRSLLDRISKKAVDSLIKRDRLNQYAAIFCSSLSPVLPA